MCSRMCVRLQLSVCFFFSSRRRHTRLQGDWSSDVCSSDLYFNSGRGLRSMPWHALCAGKRSEEHTSELQSPCNLVCRLLLEKKYTNLSSFKSVTGNSGLPDRSLVPIIL